MNILRVAEIFEGALGVHCTSIRLKLTSVKEVRIRRKSKMTQKFDTISKSNTTFLILSHHKTNSFRYLRPFAFEILFNEFTPTK